MYKKINEQRDGIEALSKRRTSVLMGASQSEKSLSKVYKTYFFLFFFLLISITFISATLPTPTLQTTGEWKVTHTTDINYKPFIQNQAEKKTTIGLVPNDNSCVGKPATKRLYYKNGTAILDDKNKPIDLKCESSKCNGKNCYSITLTTAQAVNIKEYIKIGNQSTTYEWLNNTKYIYSTDKLEPGAFSIEIYCNGAKIQSPNIKWTSDKPIATGIKFSANVSNFTCNGNLTFKQNKLSEQICSSSFFNKDCSKSYIDYSDFESSSLNNITNKTITPYNHGWAYCALKKFPFVWQLEDCMNIPYEYDITYTGTIKDLDPSLQLTYSSTSNQVHSFNLTEASNLGARLLSPILFMDFENIQGTYVKDNSVNNNYGTTSGSPVYNGTGGYDGSGAFIFDGSDDYISISDANMPSGSNPRTFNTWFKISDHNNYYGIFSYGTGSNDNYMALYIEGSSGGLQFDYYGGSLYYSTPVDDGNWHMATSTYDGKTMKLYVDGLYKVEKNYTLNTVLNGNLYLGYAPSITTDTELVGILDQFTFFNKALTSAEILNLYNATKNNSNYIGAYTSRGEFDSFVFYNATSQYWNTTFSMADTYTNRSGIVTNSGINLSDPNLVSYWDMNTVVKDVKGGNTGSPVNGVFSNSTGKVGGAGQFDGVDSYVNLGQTTDFDITGAMSVSMWINLKDKNNYQALLTRLSGIQQSDYVHMYAIDDNDRLAYYNSADASWRNFGTITYNTWQHIVYVYNGTHLNAYINNVAGSPVAITAPSSAPSDYEFIGGSWFTNLYYPNGTIDEVGIYNRALNSSDIASLYNSGTGRSINRSELGLVAGYNFDEDFMHDRTNRNNLYGGDTAIPLGSTGISSLSGKFDGSNDIIYSSNTNFPSGTTPSTVSMWIKPADSTYGGLIGWGGLDLNQARFFCLDNTNVLRFNGYSNDYISTATVTPNQWNYITYTLDGAGLMTFYVNGVSLDTHTFTGLNTGTSYTPAIGEALCNGGGYYNGDMDELAVFNKSLTASEVDKMYKAGLSQHANTNITLQTRTATTYNITDPTLISFWSFNGNANDEKGINNGTASGATNNEGNGTVGSGYNFDGVDDWINITSGNFNSFPNGWTTSLWARTTSASGAAITRFGSTNGFGLWDGTWYIGNGGWTTSQPSGLVTDGTWHYYTATYDGTTLTTYKDGVYVASGNGAITYTGLANGALAIGTDNRVFGNNDFTGSIDEVRIYNRSLSASEILDLYNLGATHISDWTPWQTQDLMIDGVPQGSNSTGKFFQIRPIFNSNSTLQSPYIINHSIGTGNKWGFIPDTIYPIFYNYTTNNATLYYTGTGTFSVNINNTNGTAWLQINNTNYTTSNVSNYFNTTVAFINNGTYPYTWCSYGNGTLRNLNCSSTRYYTVLADTTPPNITWHSQIPSDINLSFLASENSVNITYNISDDTSGINISSLTLCHKTNSTTEDITQFMNGTLRAGYDCNTQHFKSNVSNQFLFQVKGNGVVPATYNVDEEVFEVTAHSTVVLTTQNSYYSTVYLNVSNDTQYNLFEQMVNSSVGAGALRWYACNSSYGYTDSPATNTNCYNFNTLSATQTFHHTHTANSSHQAISLVINITTGTIGTVKVTPTMSFIARGSSVGSWFMYQIAGSPRALTTRTSTNAGNSWTEQNTVADGHLHQFHVNETFYYYACANDTRGNSNCSVVRTDRLEEAGLAPTAPSVYVPTGTNYQINDIINISYTASESPNGYPIVFYNISLMNNDTTFNKTIITNNSLNLNYTWNTAGEKQGNYKVQVEACDNVGQCAKGYSLLFNLFPDITPPVLNITTPQNITYPSSDIDFNSTCTDLVGVSNLWYSKDLGITNISLTNFASSNITISWGAFETYRTLKVWCNDTSGNVATEQRRFYIGGVTGFSNQTCPTNYFADGWYENGTIRCSPETDPIWNATLPQECPANYTQYGVYSNGTIKCRFLNVTSSGGSSTTTSCKLTKRISDGYFPYGKFGCAIEFI